MPLMPARNQASAIGITQRCPEGCISSSAILVGSVTSEILSRSGMIDAEMANEPLLNSKRRPSPGRRKSALQSYGTLKGEALLHAVDGGDDGDNSANKPLINGAAHYQTNGAAHSQTPQSVESGQSFLSPLSNNGLPPAIPLRRRVDSSDRSVGELSTVSGASGHNRLHRSSSDGLEFVAANSYLSPGGGTALLPPPPTRNNSSSSHHQRRHSRHRSRSPAAARRSSSPSPAALGASSPFMNGGGGGMNNQQQQQQQQLAVHPLHRNASPSRRASDGYAFSREINQHRRGHSFDVSSPAQQGGRRKQLLQRGSSTMSLYSLNSTGSGNGSVDPETLKLLPDPRWGGGSGGNRNRARSFSGGSNVSGSGNGNSGRGPTFYPFIGNVSYSSDSGDVLMKQQQQQQQSQQQFGYGSIAGADDVKEVITMNNGGPGSSSEMLARRQHRRTNSEISTSSYASATTATSIDRSVDPVMTDMTKSSMFKGVTNRGVVKLQLPKDNFRLLSDRELDSGCVYKRALVDNEDDYFQDYHITTDEESPFLTATTSDCQCHCTSCENCHGRRKQLPPTYYVMAVDSDIYRRMFDEVAESINMPCKLFYCGHHADVDYPSIGIAVVGVVIIFLVMLFATIVVDG